MMCVNERRPDGTFTSRIPRGTHVRLGQSDFEAGSSYYLCSSTSRIRVVKIELSTYDDDAILYSEACAHVR